MQGSKEVTAKDIMIQTDVDGTGGLIVLRDGNDPAFIKRSQKNSVKCSSVMAKVMAVLRDDIIALQSPVAKKKGGA